MSFARTRHTPLVMLVMLLAAIAFPASRAPAQVPEGFAVVCTFSAPRAPGTPGLFLVPLAGGPMISVTGLPPELSTAGLGAYGQGGFSVSIRSADGAVIVGTTTDALAPGGGQVQVFVLHLIVSASGAAVDPARTRTIALGTIQALPRNTGSCLHRVLPDGRILVAAFQPMASAQAADASVFFGGPLGQGAMAGHVLAIVDTSGSAPSFTLLPNPPVPSMVVLGDIAVDPYGDFAYYLLSTNLYRSPTLSELHRLELATGQDCVVATWAGQSAFGLTCDDDGALYVSSFDPTAVTHFVHRVQLDGCNQASWTTQPSSLPLLAWGLDLDRASGSFAATSNQNLPMPLFSGNQLNALSLIDRNGTVSVLASGGASGWGVLGQQGVAVRNAIEGYGAPSPRSAPNLHWFDNFPNPGGPPTLGNPGFSLTLAAAPGAPALSVLALSLGRGSTMFGGLEVLVDLATTVTSFVPAGLSVIFALPLPNAPALGGTVLTAQSLHLETNGGQAASRGLTLNLQ